MLVFTQFPALTVIFSRMIGMSPREYRCCDSQDERLQKSKIMKFNGWMEAER